MKRIFKRILSVFLCVTLLITSALSLGYVSADTTVEYVKDSNGNIISTKEYQIDGNGKIIGCTITKGKTVVDYATDANGNRTAIKKVVIDGVTYYDVNAGNNLMNNNATAFYKQALTSKNGTYSALDMWANIASLIFESGGDTFGYQNKGFGTFDESFTYFDNDDETIDLIKVLSNPTSYSDTNDPTDFYSTGLSHASSLSAFQSEMAAQIKNIAGSNKKDFLTQNRIFNYCTGDESGFKLLNNTDTQDVYYNIVTAYDHNGSGDDERFCSFGIAFYDFEIVPLTDSGLEFITEAEGYESLEEAPDIYYKTNTVDNVYTSNISNPSSSASSAAISYSETVSNTVSNSMETAESFSYGKHFEASGSVEGNIFKGVKATAGFSGGWDTSKVISTAYGEEESLSNSVTNSTSTQVELPAHTKLKMTQTESTSEIILDYSCPVYVTYKVALLAMNGTFHVFLGSYDFDWAEFDQGGMCVLFGSGNSVEGYSAVDHLYNRAIADGHEESLPAYNCGYWENHGDGKEHIEYSKVNWSSFIDTAQTNGAGTARYCIERLKNNIPLSAAGAQLNMMSKSVTTDIVGIIPLYDLDSVRLVDDAVYNLEEGNSLDLDRIATAGYNAYSVPYYGYISGGGTWKLCDASGNILNSVDGISLSEISGNQILNAENEGTYYLKFFIDENIYAKVNDENAYIKNSDLSSSPVIMIKVTPAADGSHDCVAGAWRTSIPSTCSTEGEKCSYCSVCGVLMETKPIAKLAHIEIDAETPATCQSEGVIKTTCGACGTVIATKNLAKISHTLGAWNITSQATCTRTGEKQQTCSSCGEIINTEIIPALDHTEGVWTKAINATCTEDGVETLSCTSCGFVIDKRAVSAKGHDEGVWKIDFEATADHDGQKSRYCSKCGEVLETTAFTAHTHAEGASTVTRAPTCTQPGEEGIICSICNVIYSTRLIDATDHTDGAAYTAIAPTCTSAGEKITKCVDCGAVTKTEEIPKKGHVKGVSVITKEAACTKDGEATVYCECCGIAIETAAVTATGHDDGAWRIDFEATADHDGQKSRRCTQCDAVLETAVFKLHQHTQGYRATAVAPTCTAKGEGGIYCGACGVIYGTYEIPATGHSEGVWVVSAAATCETAGEELCICDSCGEAINKRTLSASGHKNSEWHTRNDGTHSRACLICKAEEVNNCRYDTDVTAPTCTSGGYTTHTCSVCNYVYVDAYTEMLGHEWSSWQAHGDLHTRECLREACNADETHAHNWSEWINNNDEKAFANGTKTRACVDCGVTETAEAEYSSQFWQIVYPIIVFTGNFVHKLIYALSLNWLFPEITIK